MYKLHDENNNPLSTEYGLCKYRNHQVITVQELPETAPAGQLPRSAEVSWLLWLHIDVCRHHSAHAERGQGVCSIPRYRRCFKQHKRECCTSLQR